MSEDISFMRLMICFDLPVTTKAERKAATKFRQFLLKLGFQMMQYSIYTRILRGRENAEKFLKRVASNLPEDGSVQGFLITEKQFTERLVMVGKVKKIEKKVTADQMLLF